MSKASWVNPSANIFPAGLDTMRSSSGDRARPKDTPPLFEKFNCRARLRRHAENATTASDDVRFLRMTRC